MPVSFPSGRFRRRRPLLLLVLGLLCTVIYLGMGALESVPRFLSFSPEASGQPRKLSAQDRILQELQRPLLPTEYGTNARPPLKDIARLLQDLPKEFVPVPAAKRKKQGDGDDKSWFGGSGSKHTPAKRLIIVGDVHGMKAELHALLHQVRFDQTKGDHLILTGDMVNKGPDSAGVVQLAMDLGASAVRGNHEDRVLLAREAASRPGIPGASGSSSMFFKEEEGRGTPKLASASAAMDPQRAAEARDALEQEHVSRGDAADRATAASLSDKQRKWLTNLPVILRVGELPGSTLGSVTVVHAGLVARLLPLEKQDPFAVMNMRTLTFPAEELRKFAVRERLEKVAEARVPKGRLVKVTNFAVDSELNRMKRQREQVMKNGQKDPWEHDHDVGLPVSGREGEPWSNVWDKWMEHDVAEAERMTVVYGHDARRGFHMGKWTVGLDSGCVYGKKLSALVIEAGQHETTHEVVHVKCSQASKLEDR